MSREKLVKEATSMVKEAYLRKDPIAVGPEIYVDDIHRQAMRNQMEEDKVRDYATKTLAGAIPLAAIGGLISGNGNRGYGAAGLGTLGALAGALAAKKERDDNFEDIEDARAVAGVGRGGNYIEARRNLRRNSEMALRSLANDINPKMKGFEVTQFNV